MNETRFTPGPLQVREVKYLLQHGQTTFEVSHPDAQHWACHALRKEDAVLYAAAPDLYEVLEAVADDVCGALCPSVWKTAEGRPPHHPKCQAISAALSRARGEQNEGATDEQ